MYNIEAIKGLFMTAPVGERDRIISALLSLPSVAHPGVDIDSVFPRDITPEEAAKCMTALAAAGLAYTRTMPATGDPLLESVMLGEPHPYVQGDHIPHGFLTPTASSAYHSVIRDSDLYASHSPHAIGDVESSASGFHYSRFDVNDDGRSFGDVASWIKKVGDKTGNIIDATKGAFDRISGNKGINPPPIAPPNGRTGEDVKSPDTKKATADAAALVSSLLEAVKANISSLNQTEEELASARRNVARLKAAYSALTSNTEAANALNLAPIDMSSIDKLEESILPYVTDASSKTMSQFMKAKGAALHNIMQAATDTIIGDKAKGDVFTAEEEKFPRLLMDSTGDMYINNQVPDDQIGDVHWDHNASRLIGDLSDAPEGPFGDAPSTSIIDNPFGYLGDKVGGAISGGATATGKVFDGMSPSAKKWATALGLTGVGMMIVPKIVKALPNIALLNAINNGNETKGSLADAGAVPAANFGGTQPGSLMIPATPEEAKLLEQTSLAAPVDTGIRLLHLGNLFAERAKLSKWITVTPLSSTPVAAGDVKWAPDKLSPLTIPLYPSFSLSGNGDFALDPRFTTVPAEYLMTGGLFKKLKKFAKKGVQAVAKVGSAVANSSLGKMALSFIPGGGMISSGLDMANKVLSSAKDKAKGVADAVGISTDENAPAQSSLSPTAPDAVHPPMMLSKPAPSPYVPLPLPESSEGREITEAINAASASMPQYGDIENVEGIGTGWVAAAIGIAAAAIPLVVDLISYVKTKTSAKSAMTMGAAITTPQSGKAWTWIKNFSSSFSKTASPLVKSSFVKKAGMIGLIITVFSWLNDKWSREENLQKAKDTLGEEGYQDFAGLMNKIDGKPENLNNLTDEEKIRFSLCLQRMHAVAGAGITTQPTSDAGKQVSSAMNANGITETSVPVDAPSSDASTHGAASGLLGSLGLSAEHAAVLEKFMPIALAIGGTALVTTIINQLYKKKKKDEGTPEMYIPVRLTGDVNAPSQDAMVPAKHIDPVSSTYFSPDGRQITVQIRWDKL